MSRRRLQAADPPPLRQAWEQATSSGARADVWRRIQAARRQTKRQRQSVSSAARQVNHETNSLLGLPRLDYIVSFLGPAAGAALRPTCAALRRQWQAQTASWLAAQVRAADSWLVTTFRQCFPQLYCSPGLRVQAAQYHTFLAIWREEVQALLVLPLQRGVPFSMLLRQKGTARTRIEMTLGQFRRSLRELPWRLLWERAWLVYCWLPSAWATLAHPMTLYGQDSGTVIPDPRLFAFPAFRPDSRFHVYHIWSRLLLSVFPLGLRPTDCRVPAFMRTGVSTLLGKIRQHGIISPDPPLRRLAERMMSVRFPEGKLRVYDTTGVAQHTLLAVSGGDVQWLELHSRRRHNDCLVAVLTQSGSECRLLPVQPHLLAPFRQLGERWSDVLAESGRRSGRCVWCGRPSAAARQTGEGPRCAVLHSE
jgi:hypothetical protein